MPNTTVVVQPLTKLLRATYSYMNPLSWSFDRRVQLENKRLDTTKIFKLHAIGVRYSYGF